MVSFRKYLLIAYLFSFVLWAAADFEDRRSKVLLNGKCRC